MGNTYFVPVQSGKDGALVLRTGRLRSGERIGLAFTSEASLRQALGSAEQWALLDGQALRDMLAPLGVEHVRIDPRAGRQPSLGLLGDLVRLAGEGAPVQVVPSHVEKAGVPAMIPLRQRLRI